MTPQTYFITERLVRTALSKTMREQELLGAIRVAERMLFLLKNDSRIAETIKDYWKNLSNLAD